MVLLFVSIHGEIYSEPVSNREMKAHWIINQKRPLVIAHRGFSQKAPENTLPAFRMALEAEADLIELDYLHSKENIPIVIHDKTLDRTTDAEERSDGEKIPVASMTVEQLKLLDAGDWFHERFE